jgi:voltage-gated potassium channel
MKRPFLTFWYRVCVTLRSNPGFKVVAVFILLLFISSLLVFAIENTRNEGFDSLFDSLWWTIVTISTVGYGDRFPTSLAGRIMAISTIFLGVAMMGMVTGRIASFLMERQMNEEKGLLNYEKMRDHFILCGWKLEMNLYIHEILKLDPSLTPLQIIIVAKPNQEDINAVRSEPALKGIKYVNGEYIEEKNLIRAGIKKARRVLVVADCYTKGTLQQIDAKTITAVMTIKNLNKKAFVCAEILDAKFEKYLKMAHCDEVYLAREFSRAMLVSASSATGLSHVIRCLLTPEDGVEIITQDFPADFSGRTYRELRDYFNKKNRTQLIGLLENTGNIKLRKKEALQDAQKNPDISRIIDDLKTVKALSANDPVINPADNYIIKKYCKAIVIEGTSVLEPHA